MQRPLDCQTHGSTEVLYQQTVREFERVVALGSGVVNICHLLGAGEEEYTNYPGSMHVFDYDLSDDTNCRLERTAVVYLSKGVYRLIVLDEAEEPSIDGLDVCHEVFVSSSGSVFGGLLEDPIGGDQSIVEIIEETRRPDRELSDAVVHLYEALFVLAQLGSSTVKDQYTL